MPTYEALPRFTADLDHLTPEQHRRFRQPVAAFADDLRTGHGRFHAGKRREEAALVDCTSSKPGVGHHMKTIAR